MPLRAAARRGDGEPNRGLDRRGAEACVVPARGERRVGGVVLETRRVGAEYATCCE